MIRWAKPKPLRGVLPVLCNRLQFGRAFQILSMAGAPAAPDLRSMRCRADPGSQPHSAIPDGYPACPAPTAPPTQTPAPPTPVPTLPPVEGTTTTQVNVRSEPSTGSATLGMLDAFSKVQVIAKDAGGNWYQLLYPAAPDGKGWVRAEYIQVPDPAQIPPLSGAPGAGSGYSGTVTQQVNVRSGPGTSFDSLGTLNAQDSVTLTGKNPDGTWLQIAFSAGPQGSGWIAAGFIQSSQAEALPIIGGQGEVVGTGTPAAALPSPTPTVLAAPQDNDSAANPSVNVSFSPSGAGSLQFSSEVSAPEGDAEDWVKFTPYLATVSLRLTCLGSSSDLRRILDSRGCRAARSSGTGMRRGKAGSADARDGLPGARAGRSKLPRGWKAPVSPSPSKQCGKK